MIAYISGEIIELEANKIVILTSGGVWFEVWISEITFSELSLNIEKSFYIYHHITEGNQSLFGFLEKSEKDIFTELIKISWIGWKVAIQILWLWVNTLSSAIKNEDKKMIESIKWIWKKMAEKIILELKDKDFILQSSNSVSPKGREIKHNLEKNLEIDIISTLVNMWYQKSAIQTALTKIPEELQTMEEILPAVIKEL